jgi:flagellar hook protein FlgE
MQLNLNSASFSKRKDATDPLFAMFKGWDASGDPPLGTESYAHKETMYIYDEGGTKHKITVYFDKVEQTEMVSGVPTNKSYWEYMVTIDPG